TQAWNVSSPWRSRAKAPVSSVTTSGTRLLGMAPIARPNSLPLLAHDPPTTSWKCGTRRPPTLRLTPKNPISATWCWEQELKHPLHLMCSPRADGGRVAACSSRVRLIAFETPREDEIPSLQVSVP